jgi:hypothetical protein
LGARDSDGKRQTIRGGSEYSRVVSVERRGLKTLGQRPGKPIELFANCGLESPHEIY